jgi:hypothetical protein
MISLVLIFNVLLPYISKENRVVADFYPLRSLLDILGVARLVSFSAVSILTCPLSG